MKFIPTLHPLVHLVFSALSRVEMAEGSDHPQLIDPDALLDEIFARKGPQKYAGGLSEENWEEVRGLVCGCLILRLFNMPGNEADRLVSKCHLLCFNTLMTVVFHGQTLPR